MDVFEQIVERLERFRRKTIFFVCGSMKSGTTWMQLLLDAHPAVSCGGEGHFVDRLAPAVQTAFNAYNEHIEWKNTQKIGGLAGYPRFGAADLAFAIRTAMMLLFAQQEGTREVAAIGEKTPDNILGMPFLDLVFPEAKFIVLVRDGRDCAVSGWFHNKRLAGDWLDSTFPTLQAYAAVTAAGWAKEQAAAVAFAERVPRRCLFLRYEDLVADTATRLGRAFDFLGVDADAAAVAACCRKADFAALAEGRSPGQEDRASFFRKGAPGDWRNHFDPETSAAFEREAGAWLDHFGYR
jgi:hypothetical protein